MTESPNSGNSNPYLLGAVLSNTVFAVSRRAVSAAVESCAGLLSHQINV